MISSIIIKFLKENKGLYFLYCLTLLYSPLSRVGMPHIYGKLIGTLKNLDINLTLKYLLALIVLWLIIECIQIASNYVYSKIMPKFNSFTRTEIIDAIIDRYQTNFKDLMIGETITKIIKAPWVLEDIFTEAEKFIFNNILTSLASFFYLFYYNKKLGLLYLLCIIIIITVCVSFTQTCTEKVNLAENIFDKSHEEIEDTLSNLMSIYTSKKNIYEKNRIKYLGKGIYKSEQDIYKCFNKFRGIYSAIFIIIFAILNLYSLKIYFERKIPLETLSAIIIINYSLLGSFMQIYHQTRRFIDLKGRLDTLSTYLDNLPKLNDSTVKSTISNNSNVNIVIKKLGFYYIPKKYVVRNINITIKQNEKVAIIGEIGSGKSTIGKLLIRLFDYDQGNIKINNIPIRNIELENLRSIITYIPQHPKLFNRSLYGNLTYGSENVNKKQIIDIINSIEIESIRKLFLEKLNKSVGKYGNNLSGGQRQIVWLIRAMLQKSKVIILDEPTSSLDKDNKKIVIELIKTISKNKTLIIITHDMSLLKYVDRVIKLDKGKLISDKQQ
jgi:ATP-binding cassette, subfamily B, bacterial